VQRLPTVITTSVVRSAYQGESHGGIYLVDLDTGMFTKKIDWNNCDIDWQGRGGDRGLRGIAFHDDKIYIAASDEIIVYDMNFRKIRSLRNRYLRYCHEIFILQDTLYLTSTGFDSVLLYSIGAGRFLSSYCARLHTGDKFSVDGFDPNSLDGPPPGDTLHLNSVYVDTQGLHIAGHQMPFIILVSGAGIWKYGRLPPGTHNARPYNDGLLFNNTGANCISLTRRNGQPLLSLSVAMFDDRKLLNNDLPNDHARQGFCRGLCLINNGEFIVGGSSPSTLSVYSMPDGQRVRQVTISMDKRNAIHGLEVWPF
jgi:WD40 repeat protein